MGNRNRRLVLFGLIVAHVVAAVVFARWVYVDLDSPPPDSRIVDAVLHAIILAQMGLLGCWAALGTSRLAWRLTASTAGAVLLSFLDRISAITLVNSGWRGLIPPLAVFGVLFGLRANRVLQVASVSSTPAKSTRWKVSIQDVLILCTAVIALTVVSRWWRVPHSPLGYIAIVSAHVTGITVAMNWVALRPGRKAVFISLASIMMVVALEQYPNRMAFWYVVTHLGELRWQDVFSIGLFWSFSTVLESLIIVATIIVGRSCGYLTVCYQPIRLRFSLRQLLLVVTLVGVGLGTWHWLIRKVALVQAATTEDQFSDDDFVSSRRNAAVVTGSFTRDTLLSVSVHMVQAGKVSQSQRPAVEFSRKDSWNTKSPFRKDVRLWLSLVVEKINSTALIMSWTESGESDERRALSTNVKCTINVVFKQTLPGTITPGRPHIVYVEGDQAIVVNGRMSIEEFAKVNPRNYLVVTVEVR